MTADTWFSRDLPVLRAVVEMTDEGKDYIEPGEIAERIQMDPVLVMRSLMALGNTSPRLVQVKTLQAMGGGGVQVYEVLNPTGAAREKVGAWPTPESMAEQIAAALLAAAEREPDETKKGKLRDAAQRMVETVVAGALTSWASGAVG